MIPLLILFYFSFLFIYFFIFIFFEFEMCSKLKSQTLYNAWLNIQIKILKFCPYYWIN